jgi:hypothetical protein
MLGAVPLHQVSGAAIGDARPPPTGRESRATGAGQGSTLLGSVGFAQAEQPARHRQDGRAEPAYVRFLATMPQPVQRLWRNI